MVRIDYIDKNNISITDDSANWCGGYDNSTAGRNDLITELNNRDSAELWDDRILPIWGPAPTIEWELPIDIVRENKRKYIKDWCYRIIVSGIDYDCGLKNEDGTARGVLHYSLSTKNQTDMRDLASMISNGRTSVTWRDDSRVSHEIYTAAQFLALYAACTQFILKCRFKSDALETMLDSYTTSEAIDALTWDTEIPAEVQAHIDELWATMYPNN